MNRIIFFCSFIFIFILHVGFIKFIYFDKKEKIIKAHESKQILVKMAVLKKIVQAQPKELKKVVFQKPIEKKAKKKLLKKPKPKKAQPKKIPQIKELQKQIVQNKIKPKKQVVPTSYSSSHEKMTYISRLRDAIEKNKKYPKISQRLNEQGSCVVEFRVFKNGILDNIKIKSKSGKNRLDKAALKAVQKTAKFEPFPKQIDENFIDITLPIKFILQ